MSELVVTQVNVKPVNEGPLRAYVSVVLNDSFCVRDLKVIRSEKGLFVTMPSKKMKSGDHRDTAHPINQETRKMMDSVVLEEYKKQIDEMSEGVEKCTD